ncbi:amidase [Bosea sp. PAMC 26642]|uniref:amidase n=1 Tax=Bosea sp. (strain PAMC 26642) TaxID=1792307 RepID=UPI00076FE97B|nr:amidase [Bosea sp. PAMC 26642]AMJ59101.1 amidase [Bosea sp. PAMC 26642]
MNDTSANVTDLALLPAHVLAREIAARRISPVDVVDALLRRIDRFEPKLQSFVSVYGMDARLAAEGADKAIRSGHAVGPLHGVPVALKDLIELEGRVTTGGSAMWRKRRSTVTATIARRMIAQGMIVLGKTHTVEFAYGGWGTNQHMGTPHNPWDATDARTPGGSSSGSGVAVASRLAPWAIGTDTGGSVRLPAAYCGLTGLKATIGRISTYGILPLSTTLDTPGPMARTVEDAALLYNVLQGPDPLDPNTRGIAAADPMPTLKRGVRGLRIAHMPEAEREGVDAEMLAAYDASLDLLAKLGAEIVEIRLPFLLGDFVAAQAVTAAEAYFFDRELVDDPQAQLDEAVRPRILAGAKVSAQDYLATKRLQAQSKRIMAEAMQGIDALLTPTTPTPAIRLADVDQMVFPSRFTRFGNFLEMCALSLPNGFTAGGLPLSLQICCQGYEEATALRIGYALQHATDYHLRVPPMVA